MPQSRKRVRHETIANVSKLPPAALEALRRALAGEVLVAAGEAFEIERSLPHGHVAAVLAACRRLELARLLDRAPSRERSLVVAMVAQRLLEPGSKLACARALGQSTLAEELDVGGATEDELYAALDWLQARQERIEDRLARRHLRAGELARSMTSRRRISRAGRAPWPRSAIRATAGAGRCRSSTGF